MYDYISWIFKKGCGLLFFFWHHYIYTCMQIYPLLVKFAQIPDKSVLLTSVGTQVPTTMRKIVSVGKPLKVIVAHDRWLF